MSTKSQDVCEKIINISKDKDGLLVTLSRMNEEESQGNRVYDKNKFLILL
jgi:hypothetical protein